MHEGTVPAAAIAEQWARRDRRAGLALAVHDTVRRLIVSGTLPPGTRLGEDEFALLFAISRTPVREAFLRLEAERLAERTSSRRLQVAGVSADEVIDVYVVRIAVDGLAARLAAESATPRDVSTLRWLNDQLRAVPPDDPGRMAAQNLELHEAIAKAGHNAYLLELQAAVHDRVRRFRGTTFSAVGRHGEAVAEHERMIAAIEDRDPELAESEARHHMTNAMEARIRQLRGE